MAEVLEGYRPSPLGVHQSRRKRPAQVAVPAPEHSEKRLKTSTNSSSPPSGDNLLSGESGAPASGQQGINGRSKAERWFADANGRNRQAPFVDNDPPFYMPKGSSSEENNAPRGHAKTVPRNPKIGPTAPTRSLLDQMNAHNDNTDEYRSVIDDLTIQNKKLKKKLRKYERLHCSHLQEEKLFEVRVHGLDAVRKRELEEQLRSFASSIEGNSSRVPDEIPTQGMVSTVADNKPSSSSTSLSKPQDSGYASMSGLTGVSQPTPQDPPPQDGSGPSKRQNVKSYLHDIPENLAPKPPLAISDRAKRKLVVRRLEQLFTGRGAAKGRQGHSQQQQEVSQSAAQADRRSIEAGGRRVWQEGTREAHILPVDSDLQVDATDESSPSLQRSRESNEGSRALSLQGSQVSGSPRSPEQRPTRPLDLDIHRAQIPSDNIEYIRHLGLNSPIDGFGKGPEAEDDWVYLNLLTSMAQLHTLNVTPEFIRKAISDVSEKFGISPDGSKIRWLGGKEGTRLSSDSGESEEQPMTNWNASDPSLAASKHGSFAENSSKEELQDQAGPGAVLKPAIAARRKQAVDLTEPKSDASKFHYRPLFVQTPDSDESDGSDLDSDSLDSSNGQDFKTGINSGSHAPREREAKLRDRRKDDGPIIFYNRARFCTDLSGDRAGARSSRSTYRRFTEQPIGAPKDSVDDGSSSSEDEGIHERGSMEVESDKSKTGRSALDMDDLRSSISDCVSIRGSVRAMEASGVGGVRPEDNFVVKVQVRHEDGRKAKRPHNPTRLSAFSKPKGPIRKFLHNLPQKSVDAFREANNTSNKRHPTAPNPLAVRTEILSSVKTNMPPSALPPPSYVYAPFSTSNSDEEDEEDDSNDQGDAGVTSASQQQQQTSPAKPAPNHPYAQPSHRSSQHPTQYFQQQYFAQQPAHPSHSYVNYLPRDPNKYYYSSSSSSQPTSGASRSDESSSIDMLAHARELDPELVAAREQEFERNTRGSGHVSVAGQTFPSQNRGGSTIRGSGPKSRAIEEEEDDEEVMEIPPPQGSVAATVGGGSVEEAPILTQGPLSRIPTMPGLKAAGPAHEADDDEDASEANSMSVDRESERGEDE